MALMHVNSYSKTLRQHISLDVLLPQELENDDYPRNHKWPALYLLHGLSDDHTAWQRWSALERKIWGMPLAVIMPTTLRGFYTDMKYGPKYFTFISEELPVLCEKLFHISPRREDRFAAGLSMGGYGAFKLGLLCPDRFSAVASMSGALDVACSTDVAYDYATILPEYHLVFGTHEEVKKSENDLFYVAQRCIDNGCKMPKMYQCCGIGDELYKENKLFFERFGEELNIEFDEGPGEHDWKYWDEKLEDVLNWLPLRQKTMPKNPRPLL